MRTGEAATQAGVSDEGRHWIGCRSRGCLGLLPRTRGFFARRGRGARRGQHAAGTVSTVVSRADGSLVGDGVRRDGRSAPGRMRRRDVCALIAANRENHALAGRRVGGSAGDVPVLRDVADLTLWRRTLMRTIGFIVSALVVTMMSRASRH